MSAQDAGAGVGANFAQGGPLGEAQAASNQTQPGETGDAVPDDNSSGGEDDIDLLNLYEEVRNLVETLNAFLRPLPPAQMRRALDTLMTEVMNPRYNECNLGDRMAGAKGGPRGAATASKKGSPAPSDKGATSKHASERAASEAGTEKAKTPHDLESETKGTDSDFVSVSTGRESSTTGGTTTTSTDRGTPATRTGAGIYATNEAMARLKLGKSPRRGKSAPEDVLSLGSHTSKVKKHGGDRSKLEPVTDREIQKNIVKLRMMHEGHLSPRQGIEPHDVLAAVGSELERSKVKPGQAFQCMELVAWLMSRKAVRKLRDMMIRGFSDAAALTVRSLYPPRFQVDEIEELVDFMFAARDAAAVSKEEEVHWYREMTAFVVLAEGYGKLLGRLHTDAEAAEHVSRQAIPLREFMDPGKPAQYHSPANDAITLTVLHHCPEGEEGEAVFKSIREGVVARIRQGSNLILARDYLGPGALAMMAHFKWKTFTRNMNPDTLKLSLRAIFSVDSRFGEAYTHLRKTYVLPLMQAKKVVETNFNLWGVDDQQLRNSSHYTIQELLGPRIGPQRDVFMAELTGWDQAADTPMIYKGDNTLLDGTADLVDVEEEQNDRERQDTVSVSASVRKAMFDEDDEMADGGA